MTRIFPALATILALVGSACAGVPPSPAASVRPSPAASPLDAAAGRGESFARRRCAGCHNVSRDDGPPYEGPTFRTLARRYNAISLERRFAEVSEHGFDRMPPISFGRSEAEDLIAYVNSLDTK